MRVIRLRMQRFRGFAKATLLTNGPVALVGEPRAGRTGCDHCFAPGFGTKKHGRACGSAGRASAVATGQR